MFPLEWWSSSWGLTGWVGWRDGHPGHGADGKGVQSGTLALLLGMWLLRSQRVLKGGYQNALPATHAALGYFRAKFTCEESSASLDVSHLWRRQPLARNQTENEESKASLTASIGRWAIRRTSAWSMYGLQIQINFHQKTNNNKKSVLHRELPEIQSHSGAESGLPIQLARNHTEMEGPRQGVSSLTLDFQSVMIFEVGLLEVLTWYSWGASHKANSFFPPSSSSS